MSSIETGGTLNNPNVALDHNIIADILGKFLKWDPWGEVFVLPDFRLEALQARAAGFRLGSRTVTADVLESLGSLYAIALFHAMHHSTDRMCRRRMSLLQAVMCECLVIMDAMAPLTIMHPGNQMMYWNNVLVGKYYMVESFGDTIDVVKNIVRDVTRQVRSGRERALGTDMIKGKKRNYASDCMKAHSIYLICAFSLSHSALVAITHSKIQHFPGLLEAASLALVCTRVTPRLAETEGLEGDGSGAMVSHMIKTANEPDQSIQCLDLASQLGFIVIKAMESGVLTQINLVKSRMSRRLVHPKSSYAHSKTAGFRTLLKTPLHSTHNHLAVRTMNRKELVDLRRYSSSILAAAVFGAGRTVSDDLMLGLLQAGPAVKSKQSPNMSISTGADSGLVNPEINPIVKDFSSQSQGTAEVTDPTLDQQMHAEYWSMHERVRPTFVATMPLRMPAWESSQAGDYLFRQKQLSRHEEDLRNLTTDQASFSAQLDTIESTYADLRDNEAHQKMITIKAQKWKRINREKELSLRKRLDDDEGGGGIAEKAVKKSDERVVSKAAAPADEKKDGRIALESTLHLPQYQRIHLPRFLDPTEGMYWMCLHTSEYLEQEITAGRLFRADDGAAMDSSLTSNVLKQELQSLKAQRLSNRASSGSVLSLVPPLTSGIVSKATSRGTTPASGSATELSPSRATTPGRKAVTDLEFKLKVAKKEASLEIRLDQKQTTGSGRMGAFSPTLAKTNKSIKKGALPALAMKSPETCQTSSPIIQAALLNPVFYSTGTGKVRTAEMSDAEWNRISFIGECAELSVVWRQHCMKEADDKLDADLAAAKKAKLARAKRLDPNAYIAEMQAYKDNIKKQEEIHQQKLGDAAENITGMLRTFKAVQVKEIKESRKRDAADSISIRDMVIKAEKEAKLVAKMEEQRQEEIRIIEEEKEIFRIRAIKNRQRAIDEKEEEQRSQREKKERARLRAMADKAEHNEILRRIQEEERMKYLEELQRDRERRAARIAMKKQEELYKKQQALKQTKQKATKVVRRGNFMWHNGVYGFYKEARPADIPYIQYEDDYGTPYYYDSLSGSTSYHLPADAPIVHYTDKEREEFDATNGEGEYDKLMEQRRFKDQCNRDGGYYSKAGVWLELNGYYDENYMFVKY